MLLELWLLQIKNEDLFKKNKNKKHTADFHTCFWHIVVGITSEANKPNLDPHVWRWPRIPYDPQPPVSSGGTLAQLSLYDSPPQRHLSFVTAQRQIARVKVTHTPTIPIHLFIVI